MANEHCQLVSKYKLTGDQPGAIDKLVAGLAAGKKEQVLPVSYTHLSTEIALCLAFHPRHSACEDSLFPLKSFQ